jgi:hypothetical protein
MAQDMENGWNLQSDQLVIVNEKGKIFMVNEAWQQGDLQQGFTSPRCLDTCVVGDNWSLYQSMTTDEATQSKAAITAVLAGQLSSFTLTYADSTTPQHHFILSVAPVNPLRHGLVISRHSA